MELSAEDRRAKAKKQGATPKIPAVVPKYDADLATAEQLKHAAGLAGFKQSSYTKLVKTFDESLKLKSPKWTKSSKKYNSIAMRTNSTQTVEIAEGNDALFEGIAAKQSVASWHCKVCLVPNALTCDKCVCCGAYNTTSSTFSFDNNFNASSTMNNTSPSTSKRTQKVKCGSNVPDPKLSAKIKIFKMSTGNSPSASNNLQFPKPTVNSMNNTVPKTGVNFFLNKNIPKAADIDFNHNFPKQAANSVNSSLPKPLSKTQNAEHLFCSVHSNLSKGGSHVLLAKIVNKSCDIKPPTTVPFKFKFRPNPIPESISTDIEIAGYFDDDE